MPRAVTSAFLKMIGFYLYMKSGKVAFPNLSTVCRFSENVSICAVSPKTLALCKRRAEPHKFLHFKRNLFLCKWGLLLTTTLLLLLSTSTSGAALYVKRGSSG